MATRQLLSSARMMRTLRGSSPKLGNYRGWSQNSIVEQRVFRRFLTTQPSKGSADTFNSDFVPETSKQSRPNTSASSRVPKATMASPSSSKITNALPADWEDNPNFNISQFSELPQTDFGVNQHITINTEFREALRQMLWQFRAPIVYAFAYGSGVFPQSGSAARSTGSSRTSIHPHPPKAVEKAQGGTPKMIDFIFGVSHSQHWHSLNLNQHRDHYSGLGSLGSYAVSQVQERWGAGLYFNPYVTINGTLVKYGVVNLDHLCTDLSSWTTLYLAGRLHKPVKILRDHPRVRLANQINLISALRTALLLLPPSFTEEELYGTIASISYMGDPRMSLPSEDPNKVANIVGNNLPHFRRLYAPLIDNLPNVSFNDSACSETDWLSNPSSNINLAQDMDPIKRGNMVRRLPESFRSKLYFQYQKKYQIPQLEFNAMMEASSDESDTRIHRRQGGRFEQKIAKDDVDELRTQVRNVIKNTINGPSTSQSIKSAFTAGFSRTIRYMGDKYSKYRAGTANNSSEGKEKEK